MRVLERVLGQVTSPHDLSLLQNQRPDYSDDMEDENAHASTTLTKSKNSRSGRATRKSEEKRKAAAAAMAAAAANGNHSSGNKEHLQFSTGRNDFEIRE